MGWNVGQARHRRLWLSGIVLSLGTWLFLAGACSPGQAGRCEQDSDCRTPLPFCVNNKCQSCRTDGDCEKGQACDNSSGSCVSVQKEVATEPKSEPKAEPKGESSSENTTLPDEPTSPPDDAGGSTKDDAPDVVPEVAPEATKETPPEPKVVKPPVLPKASNVCGTNKNCCVPTTVGRPIQEHTPLYVARTLWSAAAWSKDHKRVAFATADSPVIILRSGTAPNRAYAYDRTLSGEHTIGILALSFSPDGKYLASAGYDRLVIVWRLSDGKRMYRLTGHGSSIYKLNFSADSSILVSAGTYDRYVRIWDMGTGKLKRAIRTPSTVWSVAISPDGKTLATGLDNSNIMFWNVADGKTTKTMSDHTQRVRDVAFSPDGTKLISGSDDNRMRLWDLITYKSIRTYVCGGDVYAVGYSPDGKTIAAGCTDRTLRLWDPENSTEKQRLNHLGVLSAVQWSTDSKYILSGSYAKSLSVWDATSGRKLRSYFTDEKARTLAAYDPAGKIMAYVAVNTNDILLVQVADNKLLFTLKGHTDYITDIDMSQNGQYLVSGSADNTAKVWRLSDGKMVFDLKRHKQTVYAVKIDPSNKWIATGSRDDTANIWQLTDGKWSKEIKVVDDVRALAWNSDGRYIAVGHGNSVSIVRLSDNKVIRTLNNATGPIETLDWSAKASRLAAGSWDRSIYVWNAINWSLVNAWAAHSYAVTGIQFDPEGKELASASYDITLRIWDPDTMDRTHLLYGHNAGISHMVYGPTKGMLSTAAWDGTVRHWRIADTSRTLQAGGKVLSVSVSSDNLWIAGGMESGMVGIWRMEDGKKMGEFEAHEDVVRSVAFSPNGDILATTSDDHTIKLWDVRGGKLLHTLKGHIDRVYRVRFQADGKMMATVSRDATVRLWDPSTGKEIKKITGARGALIDVAFNPNNKYLAAASFSGLVYVWDTSDYSKFFAEFRGHLGGALSVVFRNNNELLSGSLDSRIRYWRLSDKRSTRNVVGHTGPVFEIAKRPDDYNFATASEDGTLRTWRMSDGLLLNTSVGHKGPVNSVVTTSDGRWVTGSSDGTIRIWNEIIYRVQDVKTLTPFGVTAVSLSRDGTLVLSAGGDRRTRLRSLSSYALLRTFYGASKTVQSVDISGDNENVAFGSEDTYVRAYKASNGSYLFGGKHDSTVTATMFSHDNKSIITGTEKGLIKVWDIATKKSTKDITGHQGEVHTLNRSTDGKVWMSASTLGPIQLWQTSDGKKLQSWPKQSGDILSAALSGKGDKVVAAIGSNTIKIWSASDGKEMGSITAPADVIAVRFGGEGAWIAASLQDKSIVLWETQTFKPITTLRQGSMTLQGLHTLPNGSFMSAGDASGFTVFVEVSVEPTDPTRTSSDLPAFARRWWDSLRSSGRQL